MTNSTPTPEAILEDSIRQTFMRVVWTHKIHEKQAEIYNFSYKCLEIVKIASASLTSVGIITVLFSDKFCVKILSSFLSLITIFITAYFKSFDIPNLISLHRICANKLLRERENLQHLILDIHLGNVNVDQIDQQYKSINSTLMTIYNDAPQTTPNAVKKAGNALNINNNNSGDNYFSDDEIDANLPPLLRKNI